MEIVCEGRVFILWVVYTHNFYTSSEEKGQTSSSEEGEKKFWCGACQAIVFEEVQTEKESQPAPSHASRCPFRGNKKKFYSYYPLTFTADRSLRFSRISLPRTSSTFLEQVEFSEILWWREMQASYGRLQGCDVGCQSAPLLWASHNGLSFYSGTFVRFAKI